MCVYMMQVPSEAADASGVGMTGVCKLFILFRVLKILFNQVMKNKNLLADTEELWEVEVRGNGDMSHGGLG